MIPSFPVFFSTGDRYMTVTRPLRLNSTQALGILGLWGSVNRYSLTHPPTPPDPPLSARLSVNPICVAQLTNCLLLIQPFLHNVNPQVAAALGAPGRQHRCRAPVRKRTTGPQ